MYAMLEKTAKTKKLVKNIRKLVWDKIIVDGAPMLNRSTGEVLSGEIDYTCYKENF